MASQKLNGSVRVNETSLEKSNKNDMMKIENLIEQNQRVAHLNVSVDEYRKMESFIKKNLEVIKPQGLGCTVEHVVSWNAGDRLINTVTDGINRITGRDRSRFIQPRDPTPPLEPSNVSSNQRSIRSHFTAINPDPGDGSDSDDDDPMSGTTNQDFPLNNIGNGGWNPSVLGIADMSWFSILSSKEFMLSVAVVNLIAFGIGRRRINLGIAVFCITFAITKHLATPTFQVEDFDMMLNQHQIMSAWMDEVSGSEPDDPEETIPMEEMNVPQGFADSTDYLVEAIVLFVSLGLGIKAKSSFFGTISNMMRVNDKTKSNMAGLLLSVSTRFNKFFSDCIKNDTLANFFYVDVVSDEDVKALLNRLQEHVAACNAGTAFCEGFRETVFVQLMEDTQTMLRKLDKQSFEYKTLFAAFNDVNKQNVLQKSFSKSLSGERIEPVGVVIYGAPGSFKTVLKARLERLIARYTIPVAWRQDYADNPEQFLYTVPSDKFFDGYTYRAWICSIDDIFQKKETSGDTDPQSAKVIAMINTAPYLLPMANADTKNTKYFRSPFVMATTNLPRFNMLESIIDPVAVERRFNIRLNVRVSKKYRTAGKIDYSKIPCMEFISEDNVPINSTFIPDDFWDISLIQWRASEKLDAVKVDFEGAFRAILESHKGKINDFYINKESTKASYQNMVTKLDAEFLTQSATIPRWTIRPEVRNEPLVINQSMQSDMEIRSTSDGDGGRIFVPQPINYTDRSRRVRRNSVTPSASISHAPEFPHLYRFGIHIPASEVSTIPGSFVGSNHEFNRTHQNPILDFLFNNHPTMYEGFKLAYFNYITRHNRQIMFDTHLVCLNMHLTCLSEENLQYLLQGLEGGDFFHRLERSLTICDEEDLDYFTMEPKFWKGTTIIRKIYKNVKKFAGKIFKFVKTHFVKILFFGSLLGAFSFFFWKLYKKIIGSFYSDDDMEPQSINSNRVAAKGYSRRIGKQAKLSGFVRVETVPQGIIIDTFNIDKLPKLVSLDFGNRTGTSDIMAKICNKYLFVAYIFYREKDTGNTAYRRLGHMLNVRGNVFEHPFHYVFQSTDFMQHPNRDSFQMVMITTSKSICYRFPMNDFFENFHTTEEGADSDKCLFVCKHAHSSSIGAMRYMLNNDDVRSLSKLSRVKSTLFGTYTNLDTNLISLRMKDLSGKMLASSTVIKAGWTGSPSDFYTIEDAIEYEADLSAGDCGSLLITRDGNFQNRIIYGMHIAGSDKVGFSTLLTQEECTKLMEDCELKVLAFEREEEKDIIDYNNSIEPQSGLVHMGKIHKDESPGHSSYSNICKSKLHGKLPYPYDIVPNIPAKLFWFTNPEGELIDPYKLALNNYKKPPGCVPYEYISMAAESYESQIRNASASYVHPRSIIPLREALHHFRGVKPIASSTSPGHPMNVPKYLNIKKAYFQALEKGDNDTAELNYQRIATEVDNVIELYQEYTRPFFMYTDNLKDETRKKEKALAGLTRMFSGCPFILLVVFRMYFGSYMDMFFSCNVDIGSAIGVNPYSMDWDRIARRLQQFGQTMGRWLVGAGDFACFDGSEQCDILEAILGLIVNWYGGGKYHPDNIIRAFIWVEITNSKHAFVDLFYEWHASLPSGNPMTAIINTMYNNMAFRIAFQFANHDVDDFNDNVYLICLGDDVVFSVSLIFRDTFNELLMPDYMLRIGLVYTNELKETSEFPFRDLEEVEFLKRSFSKHKGLNRWIAPLRMESIVNMVCWTKKDCKDQTAVDNIGVAIREMVLHGEDKYQQWFDIFNSLWQEHYPYVTMKGVITGDYNRMLNRVLNVEDFTF